MDQSLSKRINEIKKLKDEFDLDQRKIAEYAIPQKSHITVSYVLKGENEKYLTESNISAIEKGIERILNEYRSKLCK